MFTFFPPANKNIKKKQYQILKKNVFWRFFPIFFLRIGLNYRALVKSLIPIIEKPRVISFFDKKKIPNFFGFLNKKLDFSRFLRFSDFFSIKKKTLGFLMIFFYFFLF